MNEQPRIFILIGEAKEEGGLHRIPIALVTRGYKGRQHFQVTAADLRDIVANFRKRQTGDVVIDYDHSTLNAGDGEPKPAAGWIKRVEDGPDGAGVLWGWAEYTERASKMVAAKEYKYVSPVIEWGLRDKNSGEQQGATLTSLALTNSPLFEKLPSLPLVASDSDGWSFDRGDVAESRKEQQVIKKVITAGAAGRVRLVADDNTETEFAVEGLRVLTMADLKRGSDGRFDFSKLPHDENTLIGSDVFRAMDVQTEIDAAIKDGKIIPAQRDFYERSAIADIDGFRKLVASMKPAVDLTERGTAADGVKLEDLRQVESIITAKVNQKRKENPTMTFGHALKLVASENRGLFVQRAKLQRKGGN